MPFAPTNAGAEILATLVAAAFLVVPGLGIAWGLGRTAGWGISEIIAAAFALTLAVVEVVSLLAYHLGASLVGVLTICGIVFLALGIASVLLRRRDASVEAGWQGLVLAGLAAVAAIAERPWFSQSADTFYHLAAVRSLLVFNRPMVTDPFYATSTRTLDPTSGVWHTALACISKATGLDPVWLWPGATAVGAALTTLAFFALVRSVAKDGAATVATLGFVVLGLGADLRSFAYPNHMALACMLLALAGVVRLMERPTFADGVLTAVALVSTVSLHLAAAATVVLVASFLVVLLFASTLVQRAKGSADWSPLVALGAVAVAAAAVSAPVLLPKAATVAASSLAGFDAADVLAQTWSIPGTALRLAAPSMASGTVGLCLAGLPIGLVAAVVAFRDGDRRALGVCAIALLPAALLVDPLVTPILLRQSPYMVLRVAMLLGFTTFVAVGWALSSASLRHVTPRLLLAALALAVATWGAVQPLYGNLFEAPQTNQVGFAASRLNDIRALWGSGSLAEMGRQVGSNYPVIASDPFTSYYLAGLLPAGVIAVPPTHSPLIFTSSDYASRVEDMTRLMDPATSEADRRAILARRHATFVLLWGAYESQRTVDAFASEPDLFTPVVVSGPLALVRVN